jgi:Na+/melibiose symporter-like transporter
MPPALLARLPGLWRHDNFLRLWAAQSLSAVGGRITRTALPIIAINILSASPVLVSVLSAAGLIPIALAGLFGGGFVERAKKRRLMVTMDLSRSLLVMLVPLAAWFGFLHMSLLICVAAVTGAATALFQNADISFLPRLVGRDHVIEGNSKLQATESLAECTGPGIAGLLIDLLGAPFAIVFNGLSFLWSAFWLSRLKNPQPEPAQTEPARDGARLAALIEDLKVGWRAMMNEAPLRATFLAMVIQQISSGFFFALYMLFALRVLGLSATAIGLIISVGGIGGLAGAFVAQRLVRMLGFGPAVLASFAFGQFGLILLLLAALNGPLTIPLLVGHQLLGDGGMLAFMILSRSLLQTVVAEGEISRANGLLQAASGALLPTAGLIAGGLAEVIGIQNAVMAGIAIGIIGIAPLVSPRLLAMRTVAQAA